MAERLIRIGSLEDIHIYDDAEFDDAIVSEGPIKAPLFKNGSGDGMSTTATYVTDVRMNGLQMQKKTQTLTFSGGILTAKSIASDWVNTSDI